LIEKKAQNRLAALKKEPPLARALAEAGKKR